MTVIPNTPTRVDKDHGQQFYIGNFATLTRLCSNEPPP